MRWKIFYLVVTATALIRANTSTIHEQHTFNVIENSTIRPKHLDVITNTTDYKNSDDIKSDKKLQSNQSNETLENNDGVTSTWVYDGAHINLNALSNTTENYLTDRKSRQYKNKESDTINNPNSEALEPIGNFKSNDSVLNCNILAVKVIPVELASFTNGSFFTNSSTQSNIMQDHEKHKNLCSTPDELIVQTLYGPVKGYMWSNTSDIISFFDIPYGKFNEPFEAPVPAQSWFDVHDAENHTKVCPQLYKEEYLGEEDCLTLSIFVPKDTENAGVLFHIYDSYSGSTSADPTTYGPDYLVPKGVILVLPNYRVGPMGFLCLQNETAPGNAGLKDLSLALEWVKDNIRLFGGNPENIVVSGEGNAGAYAGYLTLCYRSRYYVNKVITESGSALSHLALDRDPISTANTLANKIRALNSDKVVYNNTFEEAELETIVKSSNGIRLSPCLELGIEPFMNDTPWKMLLDSEFNTTFMMGSASYAGAHEAVNVSDDFLKQINDNFSNFLPDDLYFKDKYDREIVAQELRETYFEKQNIELSHVKELSLWYTDASYLGPIMRLARPLVEVGATVYLYEFDYVGSLNRELDALNMSVPGAVRGDIVGYLFHKEGIVVKEDTAEEHMINLMVDLWVTFIKDGKPSAENITWSKLNKSKDTEEEWLLINSEPKPMKGVHVNRLRLWTKLYEEYFIEHNTAISYRPHCFFTFLALVIVGLQTN